jgi:hypothetical protein
MLEFSKQWALSKGIVTMLFSLVSLACASLVALVASSYSHDIARREEDFYLRVMPLGASITYGYQSPTGNGYRKYLRDTLRSYGWPVNMVGTLQYGTMNDNVCFTFA